MLIVIEGTDPLVTQKQTKLLKESLSQGPKDAVSYSFTDHGGEMEGLGPMALAILKLGKMELVTKDIRCDLDKGKHVILDRYVFSVIAEQVANGLEYREVMELLGDGGPFPLLAGVIFYLDTPVDSEHLGNMRDTYHWIIEGTPYFGDWCWLDATGASYC